MSLLRGALVTCSILIFSAMASAQPVPVPIAPSQPQVFTTPQIQIVAPNSVLPVVPPPVPQPPVQQPAEVLDPAANNPDFEPQQDPNSIPTAAPQDLFPNVVSPNVPPAGYTHDGYELNAGYYLTTPPPLGLISPYAGTNGSHIRYPFDSYRRPWYYPGPASHNVTILW